MLIGAMILPLIFDEANVLNASDQIINDSDSTFWGREVRIGYSFKIDSSYFTEAISKVDSSNNRRDLLKGWYGFETNEAPMYWVFPDSYANSMYSDQIGDTVLVACLKGMSRAAIKSYGCYPGIDCAPDRECKITLIDTFPEFAGWARFCIVLNKKVSFKSPVKTFQSDSSDSALVSSLLSQADTTEIGTSYRFHCALDIDSDGYDEYLVEEDQPEGTGVSIYSFIDNLWVLKMRGLWCYGI